MEKEVLFVDEVHPILKEKLEKQGFNCYEDYNSTKEEIEEVIHKYVGLVIRSRFPVDKKFLLKAPNLKFIARSGAGLENIDLPFAESQGIHCLNSPEGNRTAVAEHAIGMILSLLNHLNKANFEVKNGIWRREDNRGHELEGKTVGIIGYGNMGSAFAKRLIGFGVNIIVYDKYKKGFSNDYIREVSLDEIHLLSDFISIHIPQTDETIGWLNKAFFEKFEKPIIIVNTARGKIINTDDLVMGLKNGKVLGACLDVLEFESSSFEKFFEQKLPESFKFLVEAPNVVLSPHVAGWTKESYYKLSSFLADKIEKLNI